MKQTCQKKINLFRLFWIFRSDFRERKDGDDERKTNRLKQAQKSTLFIPLWATKRGGDKGAGGGGERRSSFKGLYTGCACNLIRKYFPDPDLVEKKTKSD